MERLAEKARADQYGRRINRDHSPLLLTIIPWGSILIASVLPFFVVTASIPLVPPLGFLFLLGWRLVRPGVLPVWAGFPLGLWADLFSGQPFGCSIVLYSLALIAIEAIEARFPWRDFAQDWAMATLILLAFLTIGAILSGADVSMPMLIGLVPQALLSIFVFPIIAVMVAGLDRLRLLRVRVIG
ncbi:rod shape-determining protein MreD [Erythrobacter litoralis]|uniref:Uncharacterized protein n=1 Tax=Erythrobacter litoralis (strain HTCC2594) TaxID=314225 RepID=Q2NAP3_ERYLH|nr:rod shape-determining protein MreD [Erythrobacter litoralis]ABC63248.1 hypothetical protein ELI_05780 [Erythrobacter litoralis HTCC2594]